MFPPVAFGLYNYLLDSSRALTVGCCLRKIPDQLLNAAVLSGVSLPPSNRLSGGNDAADRVERIRCLVTNNTPSWEPPSAAITLICKTCVGLFLVWLKMLTFEAHYRITQPLCTHTHSLTLAKVNILTKNPKKRDSREITILLIIVRDCYHWVGSMAGGTHLHTGNMISHLAV